jgi:hypothetical protein
MDPIAKTGYHLANFDVGLCPMPPEAGAAAKTIAWRSMKRYETWQGWSHVLYPLLPITQFAFELNI